MFFLQDLSFDLNKEGLYPYNRGRNGYQVVVLKLFTEQEFVVIKGRRKKLIVQLFI